MARLHAHVLLRPTSTPRTEAGSGHIELISNQSLRLQVRPDLRGAWEGSGEGRGCGSTSTLGFLRGSSPGKFFLAAAAAVIRHLTLSSRTMLYKMKTCVSYTTCGVSYNPTMAL